MQCTYITKIANIAAGTYKDIVLNVPYWAENIDVFVNDGGGVAFQALDIRNYHDYFGSDRWRGYQIIGWVGGSAAFSSFGNISGGTKKIIVSILANAVNNQTNVELSIGFKGEL